MAEEPLCRSLILVSKYAMLDELLYDVVIEKAVRAQYWCALLIE